MGLHIVSQQMSRTQICTGSALKTGCCRLTCHTFHTHGSTFYKIMILRKHQKIACGLGNNRIFNLFSGLLHLAHHGTSQNHHIIIYQKFCFFQDFRNRRTDWCMAHHRSLHSTCNREKLLVHRFFFQCIGNIEDCADILYHASYIQRKSSFRNHSSGYLIDQHLLVTGRIIGPHGKNLYIGSQCFYRVLKSFCLSYIFCF